MALPTTKRCPRCKDTKDAKHFRIRLGRHGEPVLESYCLPCDAKYKEEWYAKNRGRILEMRKQTARSMSKEERSAIYEKRKDYFSAWWKSEQGRAKSRGYYYKRMKENPEQVRAINARTKAKRYSLMVNPDKIEADFLLHRLNKQSNRCFYCQRSLNKEFHIDHYIPLSRGGKHTKNNIVLACPFCNKSKGATMPWVFSNNISQISLSL